MTPQSLYWLGFIFADGTIVDRINGSPELAIVLSEKDARHVEKFKLFLKSSHKIINVNVNGFPGSKNAKRFAIRSIKLTNDIKGFGWKKHLNSIAKPQIADSPHFWRGVIDGDGWVGINKTQNSPCLQLVGGYPLLSQFVKYIHSVYPAYNGSVRPHKSIFTVELSGCTAFAIIKNLYSNPLVVLERKYNAAINIKTLGLQRLGLSVEAA